MPKILRKTPRKQSIKIPARKANTTTKKTPPKALPKAKVDEDEKEVNVAAIMKRVVSMQEYRSDHDRTLKDDKEFGTKNAHDMDTVFHKRKFEKYVQRRFKEDNWFSNKEFKAWLKMKYKEWNKFGIEATRPSKGDATNK